MLIESAEDRTSLAAESAVQARTLAGGLTHDLNSGLQALGDAMFGVREDGAALAEQCADPSSPLLAELRLSLQLAEEAAARLAQIGRALPHLVVDSSADLGPIDLAGELAGVAALVWHRRRRAADLVVGVDPAVPRFWCEWWVARLAIQQQLQLALSRFEGLPPNDPRPCVHLTASHAGDTIEVRVRMDDSVNAHAARPVQHNEAAARLARCAAVLGGSSFAGATGESAFRFAVRCAPSGTAES